MQPIRIAYSPDSDDEFMFWPLLEGKIDTKGYQFSAIRADTETLNQYAADPDAKFDVIAVSIHQYAFLADRYWLLPHGGSVGAGYGPIVISKAPRSPASLENARIALPGERTTAALVSKILLPSFQAVYIPIEPYGRVFDAVRTGEVDAAVVIHEGRLMYEAEGFHAVLELGEAWFAHTHLPLPLGGNVISKALGKERAHEISAMLRSSIAWSLSHREEVMNAILDSEAARERKIDHAKLDRYLHMYANEQTLDYGPEGRRAIEVLFQEAHKRGHLKAPLTPDFST